MKTFRSHMRFNLNEILYIISIFDSLDEYEEENYHQIGRTEISIERKFREICKEKLINPEDLPNLRSLDSIRELYSIFEEKCPEDEEDLIQDIHKRIEEHKQAIERCKNARIC